MATDRRLRQNPPLSQQAHEARRVPVNALEEAGAQADGELVRLGMGPFRPYLVTHPDHVQHVLTTNQPNFVREGMFWDPLAPLLGEGILSDGENWAESRRILQPLFTARYVNSLAERMAESIDRSIDEIIVPGPPLDIAKRMSAIVHPMIVRLFFGEKISVADMKRLGPAYDVAVTANAIRHLLPFVPDRLPLPGDQRSDGRSGPSTRSSTPPSSRSGRRSRTATTSSRGCAGPAADNAGPRATGGSGTTWWPCTAPRPRPRPRR